MTACNSSVNKSKSSVTPSLALATALLIYIFFYSLVGKQARNVNTNDDAVRKDDLSAAPATQPANDKKMHFSDPILNHHAPPKELLEAYSEAPGDAQNRAAQAGHVAAHRAEAAQEVHGKARGTSKKRVDDASLAKLVAEENASKAKFPQYPGLERWELTEKMGDGAFSNVYRARDLQGDAGQVAIKVVRKYEMNSVQVSEYRLDERLQVARRFLPLSV